MAANSDGEPGLGFAYKTPRLGRRIGKFGGSQLRQLPHSFEEDNDLIQTVFTCHGNLEDPDFPQRFSHLLEQLSSILSTRKEVLMRRVKKVEPWNSVRVTLTIPREAATRLRSLAAAGDSALQALGILSVQLEGDQVISLRLATRFGGEPQEIVLRTSNGPGDLSPPVSTSASTSTTSVSAILNSVSAGSSNSGFRSPNVVAPPGISALIPPSPRTHAGPSPFPFTSMTHAAQAQQARQESPHHNFTAPPPYPTKSFTPNNQRLPTPITAPTTSSTLVKPQTAVGEAPVAMSSPLLVNLLQTDGKEGKPTTTAAPRPRPMTKAPFPRPTAPRFPGPVPPPPVQRFVVPPPSTTVAPPATTPSPVVSSIRPSPFTAPITKEPNQPRSFIQGFSQITALSSKQLTPSETNDKTEDKNNTADGNKLIINPLTGELEPMPSESSESEEEVLKEDPFLYPSSPASRALSDDDSMLSRRNDTSDQSDSETTSKSNGSESGPRRRISGHKPAPAPAPEKIKLRFMVDKPEPGQPAYKVDLSFSPTIRKAISSGNRVTTPPPSSASASVPLSAPPTPSPMSAVEEPRVPPLHISLRGRNATVVSNKKKPPHWLLDEDLYTKLTKKKLKLGSGSAKDGRDSVAITHCDLAQKPKRAKVKKLLGVADGEGLKLKIPVMPDMDAMDLCDEKLSKKRKDSKKVKNNMRHSDSDGDGKPSLKMDSEEWISRTLKEETLRNSVPLDNEPVGDSAVSEEASRTSVFSSSNFELSDLLRSKKLENSNKILDGLKGKNNLLEIQLEDEVSSEEMSSVKKPQEIGGKIKSELSSKIDRVSGKLKNDLSKDGISKKKVEDPCSKGKVRTKIIKKEGPGVRLPPLTSPDGSIDGEEGLALNRTKRRHSGDQTAPESQAQKVKRSSSSEGPSPSKLPPVNRRFDNLSRKIKKDSVIDRLRKDKLAKVLPLNAKVPVGCDPLNKKLNHATSSGICGKPMDKGGVVVPAMTALVDVKPVLTRLDVEPEKLKEATSGVEGNTQGEDSGIESMDALSEKSPNQGESPARKEDAGKDLEEGKKGQNHDRTEEESVKELADNSCLTIGDSNQPTQPPQAHTVPFTERSSQNNNSVEPEPETSTKQNDDGLIESFESKIREAFRRDEDSSREGLAVKILEGSSKDWSADAVEAPEPAGDSNSQEMKQESGKDSPTLEDMERFRVKPPLYTYAKREDSLSPSPVNLDTHEQRNDEMKADDVDEDSNSQLVLKSDADKCNEGVCDSNHVKLDGDRETGNKPDKDDGDEGGMGTAQGRCHRNNNKSLLEQLLIEIPQEDTRRTRSWNKIGNSPVGTPKSSPRPSSPNAARPSPRSGSKPSPTPRNAKRPTKRKCSENAAELIKACMGLDEGKAGKTPPPTTWKKGELESSDDEPLSDLARSREQSAEQEAKPGLLRNKLKTPSVEEESRNNNKVGVKVVADTPTRRSVRQTQSGKAVRTAPDRTVRSTRSALTQESGEPVSKRRRSSRDGK